MAAIFGVIGLRDAPAVRAMGERLAHRGRECDLREAASGVWLGCRYEPGEPGVRARDRTTLLADIALYAAQQAGADAQPWRADEPVDPGQRVLDLYSQRGSHAFAQLNGDFAVAIWDLGADELILARDFAGARPLYYARLPSGGMAFASEYKALLALEQLPAEPDLDMLQHLQHEKHLPAERTLLRAVRSVPPGCVLALDRTGAVRRQERLPALQMAVEPMSLAAARSKVADAFLRAVDARIAGRPRFGVALSGGIDSIAVACASRHLQPQTEIHTFTAGDDRQDPEIRRAEFVAGKIGVTQHSIVVTPDMIATRLPDVVWHLENPIARSETVQFHALGAHAAGLVDLILTGVASDGLFAGMPRHKLLWSMQLLPPLRRPLTEFYSLTQSGRPPESLLGRLMERLYFRGNLPPVPTINGSDYRPALPQFPDNGREFLNQVLCGGFQESVARWLPKLERTLRAHRLSFASPFLDRELMRVAFTIPSAYKIRRGREKYILRQALQSIVPPEVLNAPKFPMKMKHDRAFSDMLDAVADGVLSRERVARRGLMDFAVVQRLRRRPRGRPYSSEGAMRLWTMLLTEIWACEFLDLRGARPAALEELGISNSLGASRPDLLPRGETATIANPRSGTTGPCLSDRSPA